MNDGRFLRPLVLVLPLLLSGLIATPAHATLSLIAQDRASGDMGALVISCVGDEFDLSEVVRLSPPSGGVLAQSYFFAKGRDEALRLLKEGVSAQEILTTITHESFDPAGFEQGASFRQYALIDQQGQSLSYTGADALSYAGSLTSTTERFVYSVQGNILTGSDVPVRLSDGFRLALPPTNLPEADELLFRMVTALEAIAEEGRADARCEPFAADAAYLELAPIGQERVVYSTVVPNGDAVADLTAAARADLPSKETRVKVDSEQCSFSPMRQGRNLLLLASLLIAAVAWLRQWFRHL